MNKSETREEYKPSQLWTPLLSQCRPVWGLLLLAELRQTPLAQPATFVVLLSVLVLRQLVL